MHWLVCSISLGGHSSNFWLEVCKSCAPSSHPKYSWDLLTCLDYCLVLKLIFWSLWQFCEQHDLLSIMSLSVWHSWGPEVGFVLSHCHQQWCDKSVKSQVTPTYLWSPVYNSERRGRMWGSHQTIRGTEEQLLWRDFMVCPSLEPRLDSSWCPVVACLSLTTLHFRDFIFVSQLPFSFPCPSFHLAVFLCTQKELKPLSQN